MPNITGVYALSVDARRISAPLPERTVTPTQRQRDGVGARQPADRMRRIVHRTPELVLVRGERRRATFVELVREEARARRPAHEVILRHLLEVLLIEALRSTTGTAASPGLVRGLADERVAVAIRRMHESPTKAWPVTQLAKAAGLSRSAFFERFTRAVGVPPKEYLLAWRMALAKDLLRRKDVTVAEVAQRVGYGSASTFSVAFTRHVGRPPAHYARAQRDAR